MEKIVYFFILFSLVNCEEWSELKGKEYLFSADFVQGGYDAAASTCATYNAQLVVIQSEEVQNFVYGLTTNLGEIKFSFK